MTEVTGILLVFKHSYVAGAFSPMNTELEPHVKQRPGAARHGRPGDCSGSLQRAREGAHWSCAKSALPHMLICIPLLVPPLSPSHL